MTEVRRVLGSALSLPKGRGALNGDTWFLFKSPTLRLSDLILTFFLPPRLTLGSGPMLTQQ